MSNSKYTISNGFSKKESRPTPKSTFSRLNCENIFDQIINIVVIECMQMKCHFFEGFEIKERIADIAGCALSMSDLFLDLPPKIGLTKFTTIFWIVDDFAEKSLENLDAILKVLDRMDYEMARSFVCGNDKIENTVVYMLQPLLWYCGIDNENLFKGLIKYLKDYLNLGVKLVNFDLHCKEVVTWEEYNLARAQDSAFYIYFFIIFNGYFGMGIDMEKNFDFTYLVGQEFGLTNDAIGIERETKKKLSLYHKIDGFNALSIGEIKEKLKTKILEIEKEIFKTDFDVYVKILCFKFLKNTENRELEMHRYLKYKQ